MSKTIFNHNIEGSKKTIFNHNIEGSKKKNHFVSIILICYLLLYGLLENM